MTIILLPVERSGRTGQLRDAAPDPTPVAAGAGPPNIAADGGGPAHDHTLALALLVPTAVHDAACGGRAAGWHNPTWGLAGCVRCGAVLECGE